MIPSSPGFRVVIDEVGYLSYSNRHVMPARLNGFYISAANSFLPVRHLESGKKPCALMLPHKDERT